MLSFSQSSWAFFWGRVSWRLSGWRRGETWCISLPKIALLKKREGLHKGCLCCLHLEPGVVLFGVSYPVWPQEVTVDCYSAAAALSLSELPLQWTVLWKILPGGDVQGHSLSLLLSCYYISMSCSLSRPAQLSIFSLFLSHFSHIFISSSHLHVFPGLDFLKWQMHCMQILLKSCLLSCPELEERHLQTLVCRSVIWDLFRGIFASFLLW